MNDRSMARPLKKAMPTAYQATTRGLVDVERKNARKAFDNARSAVISDVISVAFILDFRSEIKTTSKKCYVGRFDLQFREAIRMKLQLMPLKGDYSQYRSLIQTLGLNLNGMTHSVRIHE